MLAPRVCVPEQLELLPGLRMVGMGDLESPWKVRMPSSRRLTPTAALSASSAPSLRSAGAQPSRAPWSPSTQPYAMTSSTTSATTTGTAVTPGAEATASLRLWQSTVPERCVQGEGQLSPHLEKPFTLEQPDQSRGDRRRGHDGQEGRPKDHCHRRHRTAVNPLVAARRGRTGWCACRLSGRSPACDVEL
jgi:hypothetical protein